MKLYLTCMECFSGDHWSYPAELQDSGLYTLECRHGHKTNISLQNHRYEVLFELGLNAILDGYYREAISSFTSSLERFYEHAINVICIGHDISVEQRDEVWKMVSAQSERQYGAFSYLYLFGCKDIPPKLPRSKIELRNNVVHKGKIATKAQAIAYGEAVMGVVLPVLARLEQQYSDAIQTLVWEHLANIREASDKVSRPVTMNVGSILSNMENSLTLEEKIGSIQKTRKHYQWVESNFA
ncbi:hypothetical protein EJ063_19645 [Vibrio aquaticus]|uniref:Uncharacterized protein n=1 Tax=Vibrio aquaticus TaxID=2496559 RepID=A0A432CRR1_9VIBR|nr:hypothetical protein [Vibrio aquaticus]RTZ13561.1 hypothetical protein EJ063_19645 [Vibrio aquaticus]